MDVIVGKPDLLTIREMFAFICKDEQGNEGLCAFLDPNNGMWMPMVGADMDRVDFLRERAKVLARLSGKAITLCKFQVRKEIEVISP